MPLLVERGRGRRTESGVSRRGKALARLPDLTPWPRPRPSELYGKFTWRIDNFSQINMRELQSISFDVGGNKWYILIYPQGCDVCNHLSLFLCVANHDKLLPGWSHFAQFTIAVINRDPKKSKYSVEFVCFKRAEI